MGSFLASGAGANAGLRNYLARLLAEETLDEKVKDSERDYQVRQDDLGVRREDQRLRREDQNIERQYQHGQDVVQQNNDVMNQANQLATQIPGGTRMRPDDPAVKTLQAGQRSSLLKMAPANLQSTEYVGGTQPGSLRMRSVAAQDAGYEKLPTAQEQNQNENQELRDKYGELSAQLAIEREQRLKDNPPVSQVYDPTKPGGVGYATRKQIAGPQGRVNATAPGLSDVTNSAEAPQVQPRATQGGGGGGRPSTGPGASSGAPNPAGQPQQPKANPGGGNPPAQVQSGGASGGFGAPPPAAEREKIDAYKNTLKMIEDFDDKKFSDEEMQAALGMWDAGPAAWMAANVPGAKEWGMGGGERGSEVRNHFNRFKAQASFQEGGKQFTGTENDLLNSFLAMASQQPAEAKMRLNEFKRSIKTYLSTMGVIPRDSDLNNPNVNDPANAAGAPADDAYQKYLSSRRGRGGAK